MAVTNVSIYIFLRSAYAVVTFMLEVDLCLVANLYEIENTKLASHKIFEAGLLKLDLLCNTPTFQYLIHSQWIKSHPYLLSVVSAGLKTKIWLSLIYFSNWG